jgi:hypothetical protein
MGCDILQGYLVGRPMPLPDFNKWVERYLRMLDSGERERGRSRS